MSNIIELLDKYPIPIGYLLINGEKDIDMDIFSVLKSLFYNIRINDNKFKSKFVKIDKATEFLEQNQKYKKFSDEIMTKNLLDMFTQVFIVKEDGGLVIFGNDIKTNNGFSFEIVQDIREDRDFTIYQAVYTTDIAEIFYDSSKLVSGLFQENDYNREKYNLFIFSKTSVRKKGEPEIIEKNIIEF